MSSCSIIDFDASVANQRKLNLSHTEAKTVQKVKYSSPWIH